MSAALLGEIALKSAVCAGLTLLALRLLARRSAAERSWIAHIGLLATLLVPLAGELLPRWYVAPAPTAGQVAADTTIASDDTPAPLARATRSAPARTAPVQASGAAAPAIDPERLLLLAWALPALLLLLATILAVGRLVAVRQRATVLTDQPWLSALAHAQRRMGFKNGAALLVSRDFASPVSWGLVRPTIVINESALVAAVDAEAIIAHELAHVARLDWIKLLVSRTAVALFWFNPLVWVLARACHQLREESADDAVLLSDVADTDYAALLVGAARHDQSGLLLAANGVAPSRSSLGRRVARVLDGSAWRAPATLGWSLACVGVGLALAGPLGMMTAATRPAEPVETRTIVVNRVASTVPVPTVTTLAAAVPAPATVPQPPAVPAAPYAAIPSLRDLPARIAGARAAGEAARASASAAAAIAARAVAGLSAPLPPPPPAAPSAAAIPALPVAPATPTAPTRSGRETMAMLTLGITGADVAEWAAISPVYGRFSTSEMFALRNQGVDAEWLRDMAALGQRDLPYRSILAMAVQRVTPAFVRDMADAGYPGLTPAQLTSMRIHGVTRRTVERLARQGITHAPVDKLINFAILGFYDRPPGVPPNDR